MLTISFTIGVAHFGLTGRTDRLQAHRSILGVSGSTAGFLTINQSGEAARD
jgi:hypothetical protein